MLTELVFSWLFKARDLKQVLNVSAVVCENRGLLDGEIVFLG